MAKKNIGLNFYQLTPSRAKTKEEFKEQTQIVSRVLSNLPSDYKPLKRTDDIINVDSNIRRTSSGYFMGTMIKSQMNEIPPGYDVLTKKLTPLGLADSQGLGFTTSFLLDPQVNLLMIESVRGGVGPAAFIRLLEQNFDIPKLEAALVINPADLDKFYSMTTIHRFEVRIAKAENGELLEGGKKRSINQIINSADATNTEKLEYKLKASRGESLSLNKMRNFVQDLLKFKQTQEVELLKVTGKDLDDETLVPIDFIKQRLRGNIVMEKQRLIGDFYIKDKYDQMEIVYDSHRQGLLSTYKLIP